MYSKKLGMNEDTLSQTLWGDFFFNSKTKRVQAGAQVRRYTSFYLLRTTGPPTTGSRTTGPCTTGSRTTGSRMTGPPTTEPPTTGPPTTEPPTVYFKITAIENEIK